MADIWNFCDTSKLFKIKSTYLILFILNAATKLLIQEFVLVTLKSHIPFKRRTATWMHIVIVIVLWLYIIYFWSVPTHFPPRTYFLITRSLCKTLLQRLISIIFCRNVVFIAKFRDFYTFTFHYIYLIFLCPSDGTTKWCSVSRLTTFGTQKTV